ncbi:hypothetical protein BDV38DRAFT_274903 [Aspergillus pseudotamarii]|uniref:Uncharacterized protein n=1 Tax=Aspergillus pseudotamarii TaxID=132259 RepID=A0A5N6SD92_ASPPS|nr:uncharacterized protein BDV38DRAFT_274903 [Aspergillus pseudotamarii]KAE8132696.1 hypothetical protein BDV38DRAFT_274903 [Aspergillus pseudotamarii]
MSIVGTNVLVLIYMAMLASAAVISPLVSSAPPPPAAPVLKRTEWIPVDAPMPQGNGSYEKGHLPYNSPPPWANVMNSKWLRFAVKNIIGTNGKPNVLNFRWKKVSKGKLPLTKELCNDAYSILATALCDKQDAKATRGVTIKLADDQRIEIGVDPDEMKNFKEKDKKYTSVGSSLMP